MLRSTRGSRLGFVTSNELELATSRWQSSVDDPVAIRLREDVDRILADEGLRDPLDLGLSSNLFVLQSVLFELALAYRLGGDERALGTVQRCLSEVSDERKRARRLPNEVHLAFATIGLAVAADLCGEAIDQELVQETISRMASQLHYASQREEWGDVVKKRNAWNHTAVCFSAIGCAGLLCRGSHPHADEWIGAAVARIKTFFADGVTDAGMTYEGLSYCGFVFRNAAPFLLAARNQSVWDYRDADENEHVDRVGLIPRWYAIETFPGGSWLENYNDSYWSPFQALGGFLPALGPLRPDLTAWVYDRLVGPGGNGTYGQDASMRNPILFDAMLWPCAEPPAGEVVPDLFFDPDVGFLADRRREPPASGFSINCGQFIGGIHDQSDNGSVTLFADDVPVLIDSGAANRPVEGSASSSAGHNVVVIDGRGQHPAGGGAGCSGAFVSVARGVDHTLVTTDLVEAYCLRAYNPVAHAVRHCLYVREPFAYLLCIDDFARPGDAEARYEQRFHLPTPTAIVLDRERGEVELEIAFDDASTRVRLVGIDALSGIGQDEFESPGQQPFERHLVVSLERRAQHAIMGTIVIPYPPDGPVPSVRAALDPERGTVEVEWQQGETTGTDVLTFSPRLAEPADLTREGAPDALADQLYQRPEGDLAAPLSAPPQEEGERELRRLRRLVTALEAIAGDDDYPAPPARGVVMGGPSFREIGRDFLAHFVTFGALDPDHDVLDAGCGGGRMAAALLYYMRYGTYSGFDVHAESIDWCREALSPRNPRFRFDHVDVMNGLYNPAGAGDASRFEFPYESSSIDFVIATSLFTHMFREEIAAYLHEFARVLRPAQVAFVTAYLLNSSSVLAMTRNPGAVKFPAAQDEALVLDAERPAAGVAVPEDWFLADARAAGLAVERVAYGAWTGHVGLTKQDVIVFRRI